MCPTPKAGRATLYYCLSLAPPRSRYQLCCLRYSCCATRILRLPSSQTDLGAQINVLKAEREVLSYADENAKKAAKRIQNLTTANRKLDQELTELNSTHERLQHAAAGLKRGMAAAEQARAAA